MTIQLSERAIATILAALRYYQNDMDDGEQLSPHVDPNGELNAIATDLGRFKPMSSPEIDEMCKELRE